MTPYFLNGSVWNIAKQAILSWLGTPHRHMWMKKQRGADCSFFIGGVLVELGILTAVNVKEPFPQDWFVHSKKELLLEMFDLHCKEYTSPGFSIIKLTDEIEIMRGDVVCFAKVPATGVTHHAGILLSVTDEGFIHCTDRGVSLMSWGQSWVDSLTTIYRVMHRG